MMNKIRRNALKARVWSLVSQVDRAEVVRRLYARRLKARERAMDLEVADRVLIDWPAGVTKPRVGLVRDTEVSLSIAYWPKYERFLKNNNIPYSFFDVHRSDFIRSSREYDVIVWRTHSSPACQWEAKAKIELLQRTLGKRCLPSAEELWSYEDKIRQAWLLETAGVQAMDSFISYSEPEVRDYLEHCGWPIVSKEVTSSGSQGVRLLESKRAARRETAAVFGSGLRTSTQYLRQSGVVLWQRFFRDCAFDLRVVVVGRSLFGYYRQVPKDDFRASGAGIVLKKHIPEEALCLAWKVKQLVPGPGMLAVDMLHDGNGFRVIETSIFIQIETCEQLVVDGVPGRYVFENGSFSFAPGRFWLQELSLAETMRTWLRDFTNQDLPVGT